MFSTPEECKDGAVDLVIVAAKRAGTDITSVGQETLLEELDIRPLDILMDAEEEFGVDLDLEKENAFRTGSLVTVKDLQNIFMKKFLST